MKKKAFHHEKNDPMMIIKSPKFALEYNKRYYDELSEAAKKKFWKRIYAGVNPFDVKIEEYRP